MIACGRGPGLPGPRPPILDHFREEEGGARFCDGSGGQERVSWPPVMELPT